MKLAPVARIVAQPFALPVFADEWKAQCRTCMHLVTTEPDMPWGCAIPSVVVPAHKGGKPKRKPYPCGDARSLEHGGKCGPDALLWELRK